MPQKRRRNKGMEGLKERGREEEIGREGRKEGERREGRGKRGKVLYILFPYWE